MRRSKEMDKKVDHGGLLSFQSLYSLRGWSICMSCPFSRGGLLEKAAFTRALGHFLRKWEEPPLTLAPRGPGIWEWTVSPRPARPRGRVCCVLGPGALQSLVGLAERLGGGDRGDQSTSLFGTSSPPGHTARETVSGRVLGLPVTEPAADCTQIKQLPSIHIETQYRE